MGADAGLHADQARRHVGEASRDLAAQQLPTQYDRSALVEPIRWNVFLPISMPIAVTMLSVALLSMARAGFDCARNLRAGARPVHPISGNRCWVFGGGTRMAS